MNSRTELRACPVLEALLGRTTGVSTRSGGEAAAIQRSQPVDLKVRGGAAAIYRPHGARTRPDDGGVGGRGDPPEPAGGSKSSRLRDKKAEEERSTADQPNADTRTHTEIDVICYPLVKRCCRMLRAQSRQYTAMQDIASVSCGANKNKNIFTDHDRL